jgi:hypothetical protein
VLNVSDYESGLTSDVRSVRHFLFEKVRLAAFNGTNWVAIRSDSSTAKL